MLKGINAQISHHPDVFNNISIYQYQKTAHTSIASASQRAEFIANKKT